MIEEMSKLEDALHKIANMQTTINFCVKMITDLKARIEALEYPLEDTFVAPESKL